MESVKGLIDSFKELIWDIIGYLLPGSYLLILLSVSINQDFFVATSLGSTTNFTPFIFIVVSYLLGHVVYGFGWFKEEFMGKHSYAKKIEADIATRKAFTLSRELIFKSLQKVDINNVFEKSSVRDLRNLVMSFTPEYDQKIYMFTFRSELSNQTANISLLVGIIGLFFTVIPNIPWSIFKTDTAHVMIYLCLILCYFFLRYTRNRFYAISLGLPFSIYIANQLNNEL